MPRLAIEYKPPSSHFSYRPIALSHIEGEVWKQGLQGHSDCALYRGVILAQSGTFVLRVWRRRDRSYLLLQDPSAHSDIAKAVSKVLNQKLSISRQDIAASFRASRKLVKATLSQVFAMKKFGLWSTLGVHTVAPNHEKVSDSRRALKALRVNSANEFTHLITADEIWYC
jgi:hypothetical protein